MKNGSELVERLLINARETAVMLAISSRTLWKLTASGDIPHVRIGRAVRYDPRDLRSWIDRRRQN